MHVLFPSYRDSDLYLPLYDWQTRTVWPKNIKIVSTEEKRHLHLGCPWGKLIDAKILISKWTIPLNEIKIKTSELFNTVITPMWFKELTYSSACLAVRETNESQLCLTVFTDNTSLECESLTVSRWVQHYLWCVWIVSKRQQSGNWKIKR